MENFIFCAVHTRKLKYTLQCTSEISKFNIRAKQKNRAKTLNIWIDEGEKLMFLYNKTKNLITDSQT